MKITVYALAFQNPGESLFKSDVRVYGSLEDACEQASRELDEPFRSEDAVFDPEGRWLLTCDDLVAVVFRREI